jgi:hypothetical protein
VGLGHGAEHRRASDAAVLRVAGLEPASGGDPDLGPHHADVDRLSRPVDADLRRRADLLADRQRADRDDGPRRGHRGPASGDGRDRRALWDHRRALRTLEWIDRHENVVVCGPSGTGKTHFLEALGHAAIDRGAHVSWFSLEALGAIIRRHRADDTTGRAIKRIMRADVIVIDDIGLLPVAGETAEALYRVVDAAYEKRSIALSSNLHPAGFDELMPKTIANATVDRLMHHAHVVLTAGDSIRLTQATAGKGVTPLDR